MHQVNDQDNLLKNRFKNQHWYNCWKVERLLRKPKESFWLKQTNIWKLRLTEHHQVRILSLEKSDKTLACTKCFLIIYNSGGIEWPWKCSWLQNATSVLTCLHDSSLKRTFKVQNVSQMEVATLAHKLTGVRNISQCNLSAPNLTVAICTITAFWISWGWGYHQHVIK